jgi:shikimate kinase
VARVVFVGLPGVGKSTLGAALAQRLHLPFVDADQAFSEQEGLSVQESLRSEGEGAFRRRELAVLESLLTLEAVVATGGGVVTTPQARVLLRSQPTCWIDASDEVILPRLGEGDRPLLGTDPGEVLARLRTDRAPLYREVSRWKIDANRSIEELIDEVMGLLGALRA